MSQNMLVQTAKETALFSLNMRNITDLFPGFASGDFAVVYGAHSVNYLASILCVRAQLPVQLGGLNSNVVFVDGGNAFRLYHIAQLARMHGLDPRQVLERIHLSRAFTAYQLTSLVMDHLKGAVEKYGAKLVVVSDIAGLYLDKEVQEEEARQVFSQFTTYLQNFVREKQVTLIVTCPPRQNSSRNNYLQALTCERANVVLALRKTRHDREFALEKHPHFKLGTAKFPSDNLTLTDFMQG